MSMSHALVTARAVDLIVVPPNATNILSDVQMAFHAGRFRNTCIAPRYLNPVGKATRGEVQRVVEAVQGLGEVLGDEPGRCVAIVADGHVAMAALQPSFILLVHHMAVAAGCGIVRQIRTASGIAESEQRQAEGQTQRHAKQKGESRPFLLYPFVAEHAKDMLSLYFFEIRTSLLSVSELTTLRIFSRFPPFSLKAASR